MFLLRLHQMATNPSPKYSLVRYWRYVFVPLLLFLIVVAWSVIFNLPQVQLSVGKLPKLETFTSISAATNTAAALQK